MGPLTYYGIWHMQIILIKPLMTPACKINKNTWIISVTSKIQILRYIDVLIDLDLYYYKIKTFFAKQGFQ